jgi:hypothetical protein
MQETKFYYNQKVLISKGFHRGQKGIIKTYKVEKEELTYGVEIENIITGKKEIQTIPERYLKKYSFLPF